MIGVLFLKCRTNLRTASFNPNDNPTILAVRKYFPVEPLDHLLDSPELQLRLNMPVRRDELDVGANLVLNRERALVVANTPKDDERYRAPFLPVPHRAAFRRLLNPLGKPNGFLEWILSPQVSTSGEVEQRSICRTDDRIDQGKAASGIEPNVER